jgi:hypothetical protein
MELSTDIFPLSLWRSKCTFIISIPALNLECPRLNFVAGLFVCSTFVLLFPQWGLTSKQSTFSHTYRFAGPSSFNSCIIYKDKQNNFLTPRAVAENSED